MELVRESEEAGSGPCDQPFGLLGAVLRLVAGFALFVALVGLAGWAFRDELERFGHAFVDGLGPVGIAGGSFLADGCHFPLPPQFFLLTGIAGGYGEVACLASVTVGSILGGLAAFVLARRVAKIGFVERHVATPRRVIVSLMDRHGYLGLALATLLPVSYWVICTVAGVMRLPLRAYAVLGLMRVPRLLLSYVLILAVWGSARP